jgi:hypothetical protein
VTEASREHILEEKLLRISPAEIPSLGDSQHGLSPKKPDEKFPSPVKTAAFSFDLTRDAARDDVEAVIMIQSSSTVATVVIDEKTIGLMKDRRREQHIHDDHLHVQIASDLHIEMWGRSKYVNPSRLAETVIEPAGEVLALLGDIGCPGTANWEDYEKFIELQADNFPHVLILAGNHEYYSGDSGAGSLMTVPAIKQRINRLCDELGNVTFLDRRSVIIDGVRVSGCTLWSDVFPETQDCIEEAINDYKMIYLPDEKSAGVRPIRVSDTRAWHQEELQWLLDEAKEARRAKQNMLVLTHHAPTFKNTSAPAHAYSPYSSAFASALDHLMDYGGSSHTSAIHSWCYGHTHWQVRQEIGRVTVVSNQYGYEGRDHEVIGKRYDDHCIVEVPTTPLRCKDLRI